MPNLVRYLPKPLKVHSLARSVPKPLKVPSLVVNKDALFCILYHCCSKVGPLPTPSFNTT